MFAALSEPLGSGRVTVTPHNLALALVRTMLVEIEAVAVVD